MKKLIVIAALLLLTLSCFSQEIVWGKISDRLSKTVNENIVILDKLQTTEILYFTRYKTGQNDLISITPVINGKPEIDKMKIFIILHKGSNANGEKIFIMVEDKTNKEAGLVIKADCIILIEGDVVQLFYIDPNYIQYER